MVKRRVGGAHRFSKALSKHGSGSSTGGIEQQHQQQRTGKAGAGSEQQQQKDAAGPKPPSHLQRKITKSVKFYEKVLTSTTPTPSHQPKAPQGVQKRQRKRSSARKTLASLDSLAAELGHISAAAAGAAAGAAGAVGGGSSSSRSSRKGGSGSGSADHHQQQQQQQVALVARGKGTRSSIKRSRARLAVGVSEAGRLNKVLAHPSYKADPIQAVMNHLMNTLPAAPQQQQQQSKQQQSKQQQQRTKKKKQKQQGGGGGVMDMQD